MPHLQETDTSMLAAGSMRTWCDIASKLPLARQEEVCRQDGRGGWSTAGRV